MHKMRPLIVVFFLLFLNPTHLFAALDIQKTVLDNGLTVLVTPMPSSEVVSVYAYVKIGAATEGKFLGAGVSHFVEHMLFKGTKRRLVGEIAKEVKSLGGTINASTDLDFTMYTLDLPKSKLKQGIDIIADMIQNSTFDKEEVERERNVIHGEMRLYYDRPARRLSINVFKNVFKNHPYRHTTIGYEPLFDGVTRDDLYNFYKRNYIPNNMIISVAGGFDANETLKLVTEQFKNFKPRPYPLRNLVAEQSQISSRYYEEYYQTPMFWFSLAYQGIALMDPDVYAMDLLGMALGSGEGSRLYKDVYKTKKLVNSISCMNYTPYDKGVFEIEGTMKEDNLEKVKTAVFKIIDDVKRRGLAKEELAKIKTQAAAQLIYGSQTSGSIAYKAAIDEAMAGDYRFSEKYVEMINKVTNDDIKRVANKYLNDMTLNVTVIKPLSAKLDHNVKEKDKEKNKVQHMVLDNGMTLLIKEDHTIPIVSVQAVMNGGLRSEDKDNNGISGLFASVWPKATRSQPEEKIVKDLEHKALSFGAYSGNNAMGLSMEMLSKDLDYGLNLLTDVIANPTFEEDILNRNKEQVYVAIDSREDDIRALTTRRVMALLYEKHTNHLDPYGTKETVAKLTRKDLENYYNRIISPSNLVIAVYGDMKADYVKIKLNERLKPLKKKDVVLPLITEPALTVPRIDTLKKKKEQAAVAIAFLAPTFTDKDRFAMEIINTTLGAGLSGRLFVKVRDQLGKAYTVGSWYTPGVDTGNIVLFCLTTNAKVDTVKEIMLKEITDLSTVVMSDEELNSVKSYIKGTHQMGLATIGSQAARAAFNTLYGLGHDFEERYDQTIDAVTKEDIKAAAAKYLNLSQYVSVTTLGEGAQ